MRVNVNSNVNTFYFIILSLCALATHLGSLTRMRLCFVTYHKRVTALAVIGKSPPLPLSPIGQNRGDKALVRSRGQRPHRKRTFLFSIHSNVADAYVVILHLEIVCSAVYNTPT